jgi:hypothetical protein
MSDLEALNPCPIPLLYEMRIELVSVEGYKVCNPCDVNCNFLIDFNRLIDVLWWTLIELKKTSLQA